MFIILINKDLKIGVIIIRSILIIDYNQNQFQNKIFLYIININIQIANQ